VLDNTARFDSSLGYLLGPEDGRKNGRNHQGVGTLVVTVGSPPDEEIMICCGCVVY
jgi:hypothetical protein